MLLKEAAISNTATSLKRPLKKKNLCNELYQLELTTLVKSSLNKFLELQFKFNRHTHKLFSSYICILNCMLK